MAKILRHILKQPEHVRIRYMYLTVGIIAGVVILLWLIGLTYKLSNVQVHSQLDQQKSTLESLTADTVYPSAAPQNIIVQ